MASTPLLAPAFTIPDDVAARARTVRLVLFDVDGVLTDGHVILSGDDEHKAFDIKDGHGIKMLQRHGIATGIVTGRRSIAVERRARELEIRHVYQECGDKLSCVREMLRTLALAPDAVAYLGDDVVDLPALLHVGLAIAVRDAHPIVKHYAHWTTPSRGGRGAAREACELILHAQGNYVIEMERYLRTAPEAAA